MIRIILAAAFALAAQVSLAQVASAQVPPDALKEFTPTGKLRAAINSATACWRRRARTASRAGVSAELRANSPSGSACRSSSSTFAAAGKVFEAAKANEMDIAFVAIEPVRAAESSSRRPMC